MVVFWGLPGAFWGSPVPFGASRCLFRGLSFAIQDLFWCLKAMLLSDFFIVKDEGATSLYPDLEGLGFRVSGFG